MPYNIQYALVSLLCFMFCSGHKIKLYHENYRVTNVQFTKSVRSLLECSVMFKSTTDSVSFNYKPTSKLCEVSYDYPEDAAVPELGYMVYSYVGKIFLFFICCSSFYY